MRTGTPRARQVSTSRRPKLIVEVLNGQGLAAKDDNGKSDPFLKINYRGKTEQTKIIPETLDPVWNQTFEFQIASEKDEIKFFVWDYDVGTIPDFLGEASTERFSLKVPRVKDILKALELHDEVTFTYYLVSRSGEDSGVSGLINIKYRLRVYEDEDDEKERKLEKALEESLGYSNFGHLSTEEKKSKLVEIKKQKLDNLIESMKDPNLSINSIDTLIENIRQTLQRKSSIKLFFESRGTDEYLKLYERSFLNNEKPWKLLRINLLEIIRDRLIPSEYTALDIVNATALKRIVKPIAEGKSTKERIALFGLLSILPKITSIYSHLEEDGISLILDALNHFQYITKQKSKFFEINQILKNSNKSGYVLTTLVLMNSILDSEELFTRVDLRNEMLLFGLKEAIHAVKQRAFNGDCISEQIREFEEEQQEDAADWAKNLRGKLTQQQNINYSDPVSVISSLHKVLSSEQTAVLTSLQSTVISMAGIPYDNTVGLQKWITLERIATQLADSSSKDFYTVGKDTILVDKLLDNSSDIAAAREAERIAKLHTTSTQLEMEKLKRRLDEAFREIDNLKEERKNITGIPANVNLVSPGLPHPGGIEPTRGPLPGGRPPPPPGGGIPPPPPGGGIPPPPPGGGIPPPPPGGGKPPPPPGGGVPPPPPGGVPPPPPGRGPPPPPGGGAPPPPPGGGGPPPPPGGGGPPPPPGGRGPPPGPRGLPGRGPAPTKPTVPKPSVPVKILRIDKVPGPRAKLATAFQEFDPASVKLDYKRIETLFAQEEKKVKTIESKAPAKKLKTTLLDSKKQQSVAIYLKKTEGDKKIQEKIKQSKSKTFHGTLNELVLKLDPEVLTEEFCGTFITVLPKEEEITNIQNWISSNSDKNPEEELYDTDLFSLSISKVPHASLRLECWLFNLKCATLHELVELPVSLLAKANTATKTNKNFPKIVEAVLAIAQFTNGSSTITTFDIKTLEKLSSVKSTSGISLRDFLLEWILDNHPQYSNFGDEIPHLKEVSMNSWDSVDEKLNDYLLDMNKNVANADKIKILPESEGDNFRSLKYDIATHAKNIEEIKLLKETTYNKWKELAQSYGADVSTMKPEEFYKILLNLHQSLKEIEEKREELKKQAEEKEKKEKAEAKKREIEERKKALQEKREKLKGSTSTGTGTGTVTGTITSSDKGREDVLKGSKTKADDKDSEALLNNMLGSMATGTAQRRRLRATVGDSPRKK